MVHNERKNYYFGARENRENNIYIQSYSNYNRMWFIKETISQSEFWKWDMRDETTNCED